MANAYFSRAVFIPSGDDPKLIGLIRADNAAEIPDDMQRLINDIMDAVNRVGIFFAQEQETRRRLMGRLMFAADMLVCAEPNVPIGRSNLDLAKREIVDAAYQSRRSYLRRFARTTARRTVPLMVIGAVALIVKKMGFGPFPPPDGAMADGVLLLAIACWIPAGAMIGALTEFMLRPDAIQFADVISFDPGRWDPGSRLLIVSIVAYVLAFLLWTGAITIAIGTMPLNNFATDQPWLALSIGFFTGFAFSTVRDRLNALRAPPAKP